MCNLLLVKGNALLSKKVKCERSYQGEVMAFTGGSGWSRELTLSRQKIRAPANQAFKRTEGER